MKHYYDGDCARLLARRYGLDAEEFAADIDARVADLELKDRILTLARGLRERLPADYPAALATLVDGLGPELREDQGMYNDTWFLAPVARFVEEFGLDHPDESLPALEAVTRRHTSEFAVRPYLRRYPERTMAAVHTWARSSSPNVRRLASEGIRPRLPWAARLPEFIANPTQVLEVLDQLVADPSRFVRTSVANNLNDISRDHPDVAVRSAARWRDAHPGDGDVRWVVAKGLRTLVKQGHPGALELIGAAPDERIAVTGASISPAAVRLSQAAEISATVVNGTDAPADVVVNYRVHFRKKDGRTRPLTFQLKRVTVAAGASVTVRKKHVFRDVTTRSFYPGVHAVEVLANGAAGPRVEFTLDSPPGAG